MPPTRPLLAYICAFALSAGCSPVPPLVPPLNPCIVTAPVISDAQSEHVQKAEAALTIFGADILRGGIQDSSRQRLRVIYQDIPDSFIACQMLLQLGACMVTQNQELGTQYLKLVEEKSVCSKPTDSEPIVAGTKVFIQVADSSQLKIGKAMQLALSDKGFLVPAIENRKGVGMPALNEVRYYYVSQFNEAKLVKSVLAANGISDVMLKPLYALPTKPPPEKAFLEVWLPKP